MNIQPWDNCASIWINVCMCPSETVKSVKGYGGGGGLLKTVLNKIIFYLLTLLFQFFA